MFGSDSDIQVFDFRSELCTILTHTCLIVLKPGSKYHLLEASGQAQSPQAQEGSFQLRPSFGPDTIVREVGCLTYP